MKAAPSGAVFILLIGLAVVAESHRSVCASTVASIRLTEAQQRARIGMAITSVQSATDLRALAAGPFRRADAHWSTSDVNVLWGVRWGVVLSSLVLATVASLESFMAFRGSQNAADVPLSAVRDLAAQGCANCVASMFTFVAGRHDVRWLEPPFRPRTVRKRSRGQRAARLH
jgi:MFS superfamily sulfate permease-like transporter